jgi:FixJ family two-component response regulator
MISAFADACTEATAKRLGARGLLKKPFRRQELLDHGFLALEGML